MNATSSALALRVRPFEEADEPAVIALWQACGLTRPWNDPARDVARKLGVQSEGFLVGEAGGRLVATAMTGWDGHRGAVWYLGVHPAARGRGHGRALMRAVERHLADAGCPKLNLLVRRGNEAALAFYRRLGYVEEEVVCVGRRLVEDGTAGPAAP